jgi:6-phosphogluconolactonase
VSERDDELEAVSTEPAGPAPPGAELPPWQPTPPQVHRYRDAGQLAEAAAKRFAESARRAVDRDGRFLVAVGNGPATREVYRRLAEPPYRDELPWAQTYFVFADERCVGPHDETSHHRMAHETLFAPLGIGPLQVLRIKGEQAPVDAARRYAVRLGDLFLNHPKRQFDLALLEIGNEGEVASLLPGSPALEEREAWVVANPVPESGDWRVTLTLHALNSARRVVFLATGADRARVVAEAFCGVEHGAPHPCERVVPSHARRELLVDYEAASLMPHEERSSATREENATT